MFLHEIEDGKLTEYKEMPVTSEFEIHDFVEKHPSILGSDIFIIGREVKTMDGKFIDLLGLNSKGDTIIIEIKKDETPRTVIGQILEYAEWISHSVSLDELNKIAKIKHLTGYPALWNKYESEFGESPEFNEEQHLFIIAEKIDPITEKLARYLRENGIDIFCMELNFYEKNGQKLCGTKMIVGEISDLLDDRVMNYDWKYYSETVGWSDAGIVKMKELSNVILELGKKEGWQIDLKFNRWYCAIQTKTSHNVLKLRERNGKIRMSLPAFRKKDEPPDSSDNWKWSESQQYWEGNFSLNEMISINDMQDILKSSYDFRNK